MGTIMSIVTSIITFYADGFRSLKVGKKLWLLIAVKLLILFAVMKVFYFPDFLQTRYENDDQRSMHVLEHLTQE